MTQEIKQDIDIEVKVTGGDSAVASLTKIDELCSKIAANAKTMQSAFKKFSSSNRPIKAMAKDGEALSKAVDKVSASTKKADDASKKLIKNWKDVTVYAKRADGAMSVTKHVNMANSKPTTIATMPSISGFGMKENAGIDKAKNSVVTFNSQVKKATKSTNTFNNTMKKLSKSSEDATWNFFRTRAILAALVFTLGGLVSAGAAWFRMASEYAEANHLFYSTLVSSIKDVADEEKKVALNGEDVFGGMTDDVVMVTEQVARAAEEVKNFSSALALDPTNVKRIYASFYEMGNSAGIASDKLVNVSQGMTQLSYDLASLWDMPFQDVADKLASGLSGVTSAVRSLGIDISRTAADAWLLENGFNATYNQLTRNNKMLVIYNMLMENTSTAQGDLARSAMQPANMLRILQEQASIAARQLGAALFPMLTRLIPVLIMLAQAVQTAAAALSGFLATVFGDWYTDALDQWNSYMSGLGNTSMPALGDIDDSSLEDVGSSAEDAKDKLEDLQNFNLGFDELHVFDPSSAASDSGSGVGGGASAGTIDIDIPAPDPYKFLNGTETIMEQYTKSVKETMEMIKSAVDNTFGAGTFDAFTTSVEKMWNTVVGYFTDIKDAIWKVGDSLIGLIDWPEFLEGVADGFEMVLGPLGDFIKLAGDFVSDILEWEPLKKIFEDNSYSLGTLVGALLGIATAVGSAKIVGGILKAAFSPIKGIVGLATTPIKFAIDKFKGIGTAASKGVKGVDDAGKKASKSGFATTISNLFKKAGDGVKNSGIVSKLGDVASSLASKIPNAITKVGPKFLGFLGPAGVVAGAAFTVADVASAMGISFDDIKNAAVDFAGRAADAVGEFVGSLPGKAQEVAAAAGEFFGGFLDGANSLKDSLVSKASEALNGFISFIGNPLDLIGKGIQAIGDFFTGIFGAKENENPMAQTEQNVARSSDNMDSKSKQAAGNVTNAWTGAFDNIPGEAQSAFNRALEVMDWFSSVGPERARNAGYKVGDALAQAIKSKHYTIENEFHQIPMDKGVQAAMQRAVQAVKSGVSNMIYELNRLKSAQVGFVEKWSGFETYRTGTNTYRFGSTTRTYDSYKMHWFAKGGIVDGPMVAGVGEAGPEAIVPLSSDRMKPFADAISKSMTQGTANNVESNPYANAVFLDNLVRAVAGAVRSGLPGQLTADVYLDGTKVNKELDKNKRYRGVGTAKTVIA